MTNEQRLYDALKRISSFDSISYLQKNSEKQYGLEFEEALEMAYENIIEEAKHAIKYMRRPKDKK